MENLLICNKNFSFSWRNILSLCNTQSKPYFDQCNRHTCITISVQSFVHCYSYFGRTFWKLSYETLKGHKLFIRAHRNNIICVTLQLCSTNLILPCLYAGVVNLLPGGLHSWERIGIPGRYSISCVPPHFVHLLTISASSCPVILLDLLRQLCSKWAVRHPEIPAYRNSWNTYIFLSFWGSELN